MKTRTPWTESFRNYFENRQNRSWCAQRVENFGFVAGVADWDPSDASSRVFCKCAANFFEYTSSYIKSLGGVTTALLIFEAALSVCVLYLAFNAPAKAELLTRHIQRARTYAGFRMQDSRQAVRRIQENRTSPTHCVCSSFLCSCLWLLCRFFTLV